jgi:hypothetical protein
MTFPGAFAKMMLSRSRLARTSAASAHELDHVDYIQFCRLVQRRCELDGSEVDWSRCWRT